MVPRLCPVLQDYVLHSLCQSGGKDAPETFSLPWYSQCGQVTGVYIVLRGVLGPRPILFSQKPMAQANPQSFAL